MGFFNFPGQQDHRTFNYRPIYYDKDEEERRQVFGKVDGRLEKEKGEGEYKPGTYLRGSLTDGNYARRRRTGTLQTVIGVITAVLLVLILIYFTKFFSLL